MEDIEIEVQVRIERDEKLKIFLEKEAEFTSEKRQIDEYFTPAHENFTEVEPIEEWFRLRDEEGLYSINYKKWHYENDRGVYADEYETSVGDKNTARQIFEALDFQLLTTIDKTRKKYLYKDFEISLDEVSGLGHFVEVEYKGGQRVDPKEKTAEMIAFLKEYDCGKIELHNGGYPELMLFPDRNNFVEV